MQAEGDAVQAEGDAVQAEGDAVQARRSTQGAQDQARADCPGVRRRSMYIFLLAMHLKLPALACRGACHTPVVGQYCLYIGIKRLMGAVVHPKCVTCVHNARCSVIAKHGVRPVKIGGQNKSEFMPATQVQGLATLDCT